MYAYILHSGKINQLGSTATPKEWARKTVGFNGIASKLSGWVFSTCI